MKMVKKGDERPEIGLNAWLLHAYSELSTCRINSGMGGVAPIPWKAAADYAAHHSLDETFIDIILTADSQFTSHINKDGGSQVDGNRNKGR